MCNNYDKIMIERLLYMHLLNGHILKSFKTPKFFKNKISIVYDEELNSDELICFDSALALVNRMVEISPPANTLLSINFYFIGNKTTALYPNFDNDDILGVFCQSVFFPVWRWRMRSLSQDIILFVMVEEICHAVWQIPDGPQIEEKVTEVFRLIRPDFSYLDFLNTIP